MSSQLSLNKISKKDFHFWSSELVPGTSILDYERLVETLSLQEQQDKAYSFILSDGEVSVGFLQVFNIWRHPAHSGMLEIMIAGSKRNLGYAKQGMLLLEEKFFNEQHLMRLIAPISPDNSASKALFTSLGYQKCYVDPSSFFFQGKPVASEIWIKLKESVK